MRKQVVDFLNDAPPLELGSVPTCSNKRIEKILSVRPFSSKYNGFFFAHPFRNTTARGHAVIFIQAYIKLALEVLAWTQCFVFNIV